MMKALTRNLGWKLFALGISVLLWMIFVRSPVLVTSVSAAVEYMDVPHDLEVLADAPERVRLEVRGPAARLRSFEASGTAVVLNLRGVAQPCERTFTITDSNVDLPPGLILERAVPAQIRLRFERRVSRLAPVRVMHSPPPAGYQVRDRQVRPEAVTIVGPEGHVRNVEYVETDPIDLSNVFSTQEFRVHVFTRDPRVRLESPGTVAVKVMLERVP